MASLLYRGPAELMLTGLLGFCLRDKRQYLSLQVAKTPENHLVYFCIELRPAAHTDCHSHSESGPEVWHDIVIQRLLV